MKIKFSTREDADAFEASMVERLGLGRHPDDVTKRWSTVEDNGKGSFEVVMPDGEEATKTADIPRRGPRRGERGEEK